jgi:hypothetical protein
MNDINEQYINQLFETFTSERNKIILDIKNDTEMNKEKILYSKLSTIDGIIKNLLKYRNILVKAKLKDI